MHTQRLILILLIAFGALTCRTNSVDQGGESYPVLLGTVTGAGGVALAGVGVHYIFTLTPAARVAPLNKTLPTTVIAFDLQADAVVSLKVLRYGSREVLATLLDHEHLAAGQQEVTFDATAFTTGLYLYQLWIDNDPPVEHIMALLKSDVHELEASNPLTTTDVQGHFVLPYSILGIGVRLAVSTGGPTDLTYVMISDSIDLVLTKPGYQAVVLPMIIDTTRNRTVAAVMTPGSAEKEPSP